MVKLIFETFIVRFTIVFRVHFLVTNFWNIEYFEEPICNYISLPNNRNKIAEASQQTMKIGSTVTTDNAHNGHVKRDLPFRYRENQISTCLLKERSGFKDIQ